MGWLGYEALAGISLVFPFLILMQTMAAGGMGGGVSSAIARALGGGRQADAEALVARAVIIALAAAASFSVLFLPDGPRLYVGMGGKRIALHAARVYSTVIFSGAVCLWLANILANVLRGTGKGIKPAGPNGRIGAAPHRPRAPPHYLHAVDQFMTGDYKITTAGKSFLAVVSSP